MELLYQRLIALHAKVYFCLCHHLNEKHDGLSTASRSALRRGLITHANKRRLEKLDIAYHLCRHLTEPAAEAFWQDILDDVHNRRNSIEPEHTGAETTAMLYRGQPDSIVSPPSATHSADFESDMEVLLPVRTWTLASSPLSRPTAPPSPLSTLALSTARSPTPSPPSPPSPAPLGHDAAPRIRIDSGISLLHDIDQVYQCDFVLPAPMVHAEEEPLPYATISSTFTSSSCVSAFIVEPCCPSPREEEEWKKLLLIEENVAEFDTILEKHAQMRTELDGIKKKRRALPSAGKDRLNRSAMTMHRNNDHVQECENHLRHALSVIAHSDGSLGLSAAPAACLSRWSVLFERFSISFPLEPPVSRPQREWIKPLKT